MFELLFPITKNLALQCRRQTLKKWIATEKYQTAFAHFLTLYSHTLIPATWPDDQAH